MKHACTVCGAVDEINPAAGLGSMSNKRTPAARAAQLANLQKANAARKKKGQPANEDSV